MAGTKWYVSTWHHIRDRMLKTILSATICDAPRRKKKSKCEKDINNLSSKQMLVSNFCYCHLTIIYYSAITKC